jgi:ribosome-binding protein aMBF1 (putative translation factor)
MKSKRRNKDTKTISRDSRGKKRKEVPPYEVVDLDAWIADLVGDDEDARTSLEETRSSFSLIRDLISLRDKANLTQKQLAEKMGLTQQMVSKMENINYEGRTFAKIWRHADALGYRPVIKFEPVEKWRKKHPIPGLDDTE